MSRRGRSGPAISLFAFQDIITSVTAIVIVVVLFLALELLQRKEKSTSNPSADLAVEIKSRLAELESELVQSRATSVAKDDLIQAVASTSPAELREEITRRILAIAQLQLDQERLSNQKKQVDAKEKIAVVEQIDLDELRKKTITSDRESAELERQVEQEKGENRIVFTLPRGFKKEGWLVVVEKNRLLVAPIGRQQRPIEFRATGLPWLGKIPADEFGAWIENQHHQDAYFLLLARPEAVNLLDQTTAFLNARSISHGFDLVDGDAAVLHPEKGAAP